MISSDRSGVNQNQNIYILIFLKYLKVLALWDLEEKKLITHYQHNTNRIH